MRLFIAINFDEPTKLKISQVQTRLKENASGSFPRQEYIHLTLAFLGEVSPPRIKSIKHAMNKINIPKITLTFDHTGFFSRADGDIWWIGLKRSNSLTLLQKQLTKALLGADFALEQRAFTPHITLARRVRLRKQVDQTALLNSQFSTKVDAISLMRSERVDGKLTYTELYRVCAVSKGYTII